MRAAIATSLAFAALVAGCHTVKPVAGRTAPLGKELELQLPATPGYPEKLDVTQTIVAQYGERRTALQAVLALSSQRVEAVLTTVGGPRILSVTWTSAGIVEDRTLLAPEELKGISILADIYMSLWPIEAVRASLPAGTTASETATVRTIAAADRTVLRVETLEKTETLWRQKLSNLDFGYSLTIITEREK